MSDHLTTRQRAARNSHRRGWRDALRAVGVDPDAVPYLEREAVEPTPADLLGRRVFEPKRDEDRDRRGEVI